MEWKRYFSSMVNERLEDSAIAVVMKTAALEDALLLAAGEPLAELCPEEELKASFRRALEQEDHTWGYSQHRTGVPLLREWIAEWMKRDGLLSGWVGPENIFVTNGSQEGLSMITECFLDPGETVMVESPSYPDAFGVFRRDGLLLEGVDLLPDGPDIAAMKELLSKKRVKAFYTIPAFQNPTGFSTSDEKKRMIIDLAREHDFLIIEDDPYRNVSFDGSPGGTYLAAAGSDQRVIYLGSFSKVIAPGLRCGWAVVPEPVINVLLKLRTAGTLCLPDVVQRAVQDFVSRNDFDGHLRRICSTYRDNRDALAASLIKHAASEGLEINSPSGGFFMWGRVPWIEDMERFAFFAMKEARVAVIPGSHFFPAPGKGMSEVRFSYARVTPAMAEEGAKRLGEALRKFRAVQEGRS